MASVVSSSARYDPTMLDDPELRYGKHQKVLQFLSYRVRFFRKAPALVPVCVYVCMCVCLYVR